MDLPDDLERVAEELNTLVRPQAARAAQESDRLIEWLTQLVDRRGSELLLVAGAPPSGRFDGRVESRAYGWVGTIDNSYPLSIGGKVDCDQRSVGCDYYAGDLDRIDIGVR